MPSTPICAAAGQSGRPERRRRALSGPAILALALWGLPSPASAQGYADWFSGLKVAPPAGYAARKMPARGAFGTRVSVLREGDVDTGCQVGFSRTDAAKAYTQAGVNMMMRQKEYHQIARSVLGVLFVTRSTRVVEYGGVAGLEMVSDIKPQAGMPARARQIRIYFLLMHTPKGRTAVICAGEKASFARRKAEFVAVSRGVTPPS